MNFENPAGQTTKENTLDNEIGDGQYDRQTYRQLFKQTNYTLRPLPVLYQYGIPYGSRDKARCLPTWHDLIARMHPSFLGHIAQPFIRGFVKQERGGAELEQPWRPVTDS